jgi:hypothetical protein
MINKFWFNRIWNLDLRNGIGFDIEFVDSKLVWAYNPLIEDFAPRTFYGTVILLPFFTIQVGKLVAEEE